MKRQTWILGIMISLGISLVALSPRLLRMASFDACFVAVTILYNFSACFTCWAVYQYIFNRTRLLQANKHKFLIAAILILASSLPAFLYNYIFSLLTPQVLQFPEITGSKRPYMLLLRGLLVSGLYYFISYYLYVLSEKQRSLLEIEKLKQANLAANLSSLKQQLSPHFLFNTLNTLSSLTQEKPVKDYVAELANVYRYVLQYKEMDKATLQQELSFIQSYLYIIKTRFENAIEVTIHVDNSVMKSKIPPLTLQLLIENAIKHNIASATKQLRIQIYNEAAGHLVISNNLQPKSSVKIFTGIGLQNIMQRYQLLFKREVIIEKNASTFTVKLPII